MTLPVQDAAYPSPSQIRDGGLRLVKYAYARIGIDRNVLPGSDDYERFDVFASRAGIGIANNEISQDDADPTKATGQALVNLAAIFGVFPRPAAGAAGAFAATWAGANVTIPINFTGTAPDGHKYRAAPGTYTTGTPIPVTAVSTGASTNQIAGTVITWDSAVIGALAPTAAVATGGLTGGVDTDSEETLRQRLLLRLAAAAVGGNWSSIVEWAGASTASVEAAYCYPAAGGPASYHVAVTALGGDRTLPGPIVSIVKSYILARMPGQNFLTCTTVTPQGVDVSLKARLPLPQSAGGAGGGWRDPSPWPVGEDVVVTGYSAPTATCNATVAPVVGQSVGVWDPSYVDPITGLVVGVMREFTVSVVGGSSGAYTLQVQGGFTHGSPLHAYISAGAVSLVQYARAFADGVSVLGPGEITAMPELLPRSARQPPTDMSAPSDLTSRLLDLVQTPYAEIIDLQYGVSYKTLTTTPITSPDVPSTTASPPNVIVLKNFAIRKE